MAKAVIASATSASGMTVSRVTPGQGRLGSGSTDEAGLVQVCPARVCGGRAAVEQGRKERGAGQGRGAVAGPGRPYGPVLFVQNLNTGPGAVRTPPGPATAR
ncbi:hypothetical protein GCM10018781_53390 [Kitasatospora indigofera]|uniref:Uncharacterized protein n=1 Tax=Kitasatospora indigofera TaxID=67307 RepID=A0A919KZB6_9ACTN|nr:hypothetical protein GCM10018781_53390 [Kitasatospora indigofera]